MQNPIQGGAYQPVVTVIEVAEPPVSGVPVPGAEPPSTARLQQACNWPRHFMRAFLVAGILAATVFGIGTGTGDTSYLTAGFISIVASAVGTAASLRQTTETYELAGSFGDDKAITMAAMYFGMMCWSLSAMATHLSAEIPNYRQSS